ncbi:outer membrane beta-barrel protein [Pedobacter sp. MC2016-24]|uniref:type IX secretion/gliding motility protein PorT/SprT n=1 Tax=Pedobacter sp. MC2016-24 TaxID=2780090 RepID=UPI001880D9E8|nr:outer membrane beta-barrel protein [Pedobacter sp. MC2016-24]MBE9602153.1 outer membrane beta-barrel protein [Pedobacter sp. MC2016-24]
MKPKLYLLLVGIFFLNAAKAQNWGGGIDDNTLHFGFTFQYISSEFKFLKKRDWTKPFYDKQDETLPPIKATDTLNALYSKTSPGFGIGLLVNLKVSEHSDLRFTPTLVFNDRLAYYDFNVNGAPATIERRVQATMVDLPISFKLKSDRRNNFRAYMIGGAKYSVDISSKKKTNDDPNSALEKFLKNKRGFFSAEAGLGMDLYFEYFKMSPEIKLSYSLNNILTDGGKPSAFSQPIDKLMLRHVTFSLFFE